MIARTTRGKYTDLTYQGHVVAADTQGRILYHHGDPFRFTFARSSTKPFQALLALESGAADFFGITDKELAIMCASHGGTTEHAQTVASLLRKAGLGPEDLCCGAHAPLMKKGREELKALGEEPTALHNNCSGKHAAMLLTAKFLGETLSGYREPTHPHQKRITALLGEFMAMHPDRFGLATDGCGVPVHAAPLYKWAQAFARLAEPIGFSPQRVQAIRRITQAMADYPEMISGEGRLCTDLMIHFKDRLIAKGGAEAFYALGIKELGLGLAVKVESGEAHLLPGIVLEALRQIGVITPEEKEPFFSYIDQKIKNHQGEIVGETLIDFVLKANLENIPPKNPTPEASLKK